MLVGKVVRNFERNGKKVRIRYPGIEDVDDLLESLIKENAYISMEKKLKRKDEISWLSGVLEKVENKKSVMLVLEVNGKVVGNCETTPKDRKEEHVAGMGIFIRKSSWTCFRITKPP